MSANTKSPSFKLAPGTGSILAEATTEFFNPASVGKNLHITWPIGRDTADIDASTRYVLTNARHVLKREAAPHPAANVEYLSVQSVELVQLPIDEV